MFPYDTGHMPHRKRICAYLTFGYDLLQFTPQPKDVLLESEKNSHPSLGFSTMKEKPTVEDIALEEQRRNALYFSF
jgi:hypothetical protein